MAWVVWAARRAFLSHACHRATTHLSPDNCASITGPPPPARRVRRVPGRSATEGGIFATLAGRYFGVANLDLILKGSRRDPLIVEHTGTSAA